MVLIFVRFSPGPVQCLSCFPEMQKAKKGKFSEFICVILEQNVPSQTAFLRLKGCPTTNLVLELKNCWLYNMKSSQKDSCDGSLAPHGAAVLKGSARTPMEKVYH